MAFWGLNNIAACPSMEGKRYRLTGGGFDTKTVSDNLKSQLEEFNFEFKL